MLSSQIVSVRNCREKSPERNVVFSKFGCIRLTFDLFSLVPAANKLLQNQKLNNR